MPRCNGKAYCCPLSAAGRSTLRASSSKWLGEQQGRGQNRQRGVKQVNVTACGNKRSKNMADSLSSMDLSKLTSLTVGGPDRSLTNEFIDKCKSSLRHLFIGDIEDGESLIS